MPDSEWNPDGTAWGQMFKKADEMCQRRYDTLVGLGVSDSLALASVWNSVMHAYGQGPASTDAAGVMFEEELTNVVTEAMRLYDSDERNQMRKVMWEEVAASSEGGVSRVEAGPYVARIVGAEDFEEREYVSFVYDIAEGPHAGHYSDAWGQEHPYSHRIVMSYKEKALGMLKGRLERFNESNPGFDAFAAWDAGRLDLFVGRTIGINLQEEEYYYEGEVRTRLNVCQVVAAQDVRDGKIKTRPKKELDSASKTAASANQAATPWSGQAAQMPAPAPAFTQADVAYAQQAPIPFS